jgi:hypothetical protein
MPDFQYGVRGPDPRNTVVLAPNRESAIEMLLPDERLMVRDNAFGEWGEWREAPEDPDEW